MKSIALIFALLMSANAYAGCSLKGKNYPEGAVKDGYVCDSQGYWKKS